MREYKGQFICALIAAVVIITVGSIISCRQPAGGGNIVPITSDSALSTVPDFTPYFDEAKTQSDAAIEESLQGVAILFSKAQRRSRSFADDALGLGSKGRLVVDYIPFVDTNWNETFLKQKFKEKVLSEHALSQEISSAVKTYLLRLGDIDNKILTKILIELDVDLEDLPETSPSNTPDSRYQGAVKQIITISHDNAIESIGTDIALFGVSVVIESMINSAMQTTFVQGLASTIGQQIASSLGVSGVLLGTGGATAGYTAGISVVATFIIDAIVSYIWDWWADPKGDLALKINQQLDRIRSATINALRSKFTEIAQNQDNYRREYYPKAIQTYLNPTSEPSQAK